MPWSAIPKGNSALCIIGAGFQIGVLKNALPSTTTILQEAANKYPNDYPIINEIISANYFRGLTLNRLWSDIYKFASFVSYAYSRFFNHHMRIKSNMKEFFDALSKGGRNPIDILWLGLGLELKKAVSQFYHPTNKGNFNSSKIDNIKTIINNFDKRVWVSLNYDLVLEEALAEIHSVSLFNGTTDQVRYLNEEFVNNSISIFNPKRLSKDIIIKPHGSINLSFETNWTEPPTHALVFVDPDNYLTTFDHNKIGYEIRNGSAYESRPCIIGYVPDDFKDEHNSKSYYSDIAHDFCKLQMTSITFAISQADCIFILGYSMPAEDEWLWKRMKDIQNKNKQIIICSHSDSQRIENEFHSLGFRNTSILNNGII